MPPFGGRKNGNAKPNKNLLISLPKIVVIGPESTGKSTLSAALATTWHTAWVPEYARDYLTALQRPYTEQDLWTMAQGQLAAENEKEKKAHRLLICDTNLYVHKVWSEHAYHRCHRNILHQIAIRPYHLYLLTGIDMPWSPDPLREHPEPKWRDYFYRQYQDLLIHSGVPWVAVMGSHEQRLQTANEAIAAIIQK